MYKDVYNLAIFLKLNKLHFSCAISLLPKTHYFLILKSLPYEIPDNPLKPRNIAI